MKTLVLIGLCFFSVGAFAQTTSKTKKAKPAVKKEAKAPAKKEETNKTEAEAEQKQPVTFKTLVIERNDIPYDSKEPFIFEFKNTGSTPVMITNVAPSCGCTTAEKPEEPIEKGKSSKIVVGYDTKRVGTFEKSITVMTNVSTEPIILRIKGTVLPAPAEPAPVAPASN